MIYLKGTLIVLTLFIPAIHASSNACCYDEKLVKDKLVADEALFQASIAEWIWPNRTVYYDVDPHMDPVIRHFLAMAIDYYNNNNVSCVRWKQRLPDQSEDPKKHWVTFVQLRDAKRLLMGAEFGWIKDRRNTLLRIGYHFTKNILTDILRTKNKAPNPLWARSQEYLTQILHEMMHVMGFLHEHQRGDRDCWVFIDGTFLKNNYLNLKIIPEWTRYFSPKFPYDYRSIMHYPRVGDMLYGHDENTLGRADARLSYIDKFKLNYVYCDQPAYCDIYTICDVDVKSYRYNPKCFREGEYYNFTPTTCTPCQRTDY